MNAHNDAEEESAKIGRLNRSIANIGIDRWLCR